MGTDFSFLRDLSKIKASRKYTCFSEKYIDTLFLKPGFGPGERGLEI